MSEINNAGTSKSKRPTTGCVKKFRVVMRLTKNVRFTPVAVEQGDDPWCCYIVS